MHTTEHFQDQSVQDPFINIEGLQEDELPGEHKLADDDDLPGERKPAAGYNIDLYGAPEPPVAHQVVRMFCELYQCDRISADMLYAFANPGVPPGYSANEANEAFAEVYAIEQK